MTYEIYRYIFIGSAVLCGISLAATLIIFIALKIPKVMGDLSGATAKKAIKDIRRRNEETGEKNYKGSAFNEARGKLTDKISSSGEVVQRHGTQTHAAGTSKIGTQSLGAYTMPNGESDETTLLDAYGKTTVDLDESPASETTLLDSFAVGTLDLDAHPTSETTILGTPCAEVFEIEYEITYIHTDEIIYAEAVQ